MNGNLRRSFLACVWACALLGVLFLTGCGSVGEPFLPETTVANLPGEDLAGPCTYALRVAEGPVVPPALQPTQIPQTGVLVVYEREDSLTLFDDPTVIATAQGLHLAMLYAYQCDAASFDDLQPNASDGPGRALFQALDQFAVSLNHPELASANVFLTGFSAAGYLAVTTAAEYPRRILGTIPYAPASSIYDIGSLDVTPALAKVPSLILVSATDVAAGDQRPFFLFQSGWAQGSPWGFASQHSLNHCCVDSIAPILNPWVTGIFEGYTSPASSGLVSLQGEPVPAPATVGFQIASDGSFDPFGYQDFYFGSASILPASTQGEPFEGWLPNQTTAQEWLTWVTNPNGN